MSDDEVQSTLAAVQAFLRQQHALSGNIIYRDAARAIGPDAPHPAEAVVPELFITKEHEAEAPVAKRSKQQSHEPSAADARSGAPEVRHGASKAASDALWQQADSLARLNEFIRACAECPLSATRTKFVFGVGPADAKAMVIGEAPGADEDAQGEPFVGRAGQLLNKILESVQFKRGDVFIANILKCRPPNNRRPLPSEVEHCEPYLWKQIELIKPKIILCLGLTAAQTLLKTTASLGALRESTQEYRGIPLVVTYHPAALLRNPNWKRPTWEDVKKFRKLHDELV